MLSWAPKRDVSAWPTKFSMSQGQVGLAKTTSEVATEKADPESIAGNQGSLTLSKDSSDIKFLAGTVESTASIR